MAAAIVNVISEDSTLGDGALIESYAVTGTVTNLAVGHEILAIA